MRVGKLRHYVTIQQKNSRNSRGELVRTWATLKNAYAQVRSISGKEYQAAYDQNKAVVSWRVFMRVDHAVKPTMRIIWNDRALNIVSVLPDETDSKFMQVMCTEDDK